MASNEPIFTAVSSSSRQILILLRCISFAKKANVRISPEGIRFGTEEASTMEAFVFLEKALFTSYKCDNATSALSGDGIHDVPVFEVNLASLLETLHIFTISDTNTSRRQGEYDAFTAHRLTRHVGTHTFSNQAMGVTGICTFSYHGDGSPLYIYMSEAGVTTTCELTTYQTESAEEIPFNRDDLSLKTIMGSTYLLDAINELTSMSPNALTIQAASSGGSGAKLSLSAVGPLGSATMDFTTEKDFETPILETFQCPSKAAASFKFSLIRAAQRAMASSSKVSLRLDTEGVLSMQFLVEIDAGGGSDGVAFVDFRMVPLVEDEGMQESESDVDGSDD